MCTAASDAPEMPLVTVLPLPAVWQAEAPTTYTFLASTADKASCNALWQPTAQRGSLFVIRVSRSFHALVHKIDGTINPLTEAGALSGMGCNHFLADVKAGR